MITDKQLEYYNKNRLRLIKQYLKVNPRIVDPDLIRDLFMPIGYNRRNVEIFKDIGKQLTEDIFFEALKTNLSKTNSLIFAGGLPATGKSTHLKSFAQNDLIYDGTINNKTKFLDYIKEGVKYKYNVSVLVYSANPLRCFATNLVRGDNTGRYVPIFQYEKVAESLNERKKILKTNFQNDIRFRNFEHTNFEGQPQDFQKIVIERIPLEYLAYEHAFTDSSTLLNIIS